ncbi:MAG: hypothetical protein CL908_12945 [Deltaproteobacteria bacterium]|nr:hypothetical protein [Deltaproteobacteria bacterium]
MAADESDESEQGVREMPRVDFSTFVLSLGTTALYQLGVVPDLESGKAGEADPLVAQQTIDTLEMLREKTCGNLDDEERNLIDSLLYELRMRFVERTR